MENTHTYTQLYHIEYISLDIVELLDEAKTMTTIGYHEHIVNLQGLSIVEGGTNLVSEVNRHLYIIAMDSLLFKWFEKEK